MTDYKKAARERITRDLKYADEQLDLVGRVLTFSEDRALVQGFEIRYTNRMCLGRPMIYADESRFITINIVLQRRVYWQDHDHIMDKIRLALEERGIDTEDFFSYCNKSYGIEREGIDVHFGFGM